MPAVVSPMGVSPINWRLEFLDRGTEHAFLRHALDDWMRGDLQTFFVGMVIETLGLILVLRSRTWRLLVDLLPCILRITIASVGLRVSVARQAWYKHNRQWLVPFLRIILVASVAASGQGYMARLGSEQALPSKLLSSSPVLSLWIVSIGHRLPFKKHLLSQTISTFFSLIWVLGFQGYCAQGGSIWGVERLIGGLIHSSSQIQLINSDRRAYSCWATGSIYCVCLGLILPTAVVYVSELISRRSFVSRLIPAHARAELEAVVSATLFMAALWTVVGCQIVLLCITSVTKLVSDILENQICFDNRVA